MVSSLGPFKGLVFSVQALESSVTWVGGAKTLSVTVTLSLFNRRRRCRYSQHNMTLTWRLCSPRRHTYVPSTSDVYRVTVAALRLPAGKFNPIFSNFSRRTRPPFLDLALKADKQ